MKCRDCGGERDRQNEDTARPDICSICWNVRGIVVKARMNGLMKPEDFTKYQRNGLRTKRLEKMGYDWIVQDAKKENP